MGKRYVIQYCTKCIDNDGKESFEYLDCVDEKGKVNNFLYEDVLKLLNGKKTLFFIIVNGINSLIYAVKEKNGSYTLRSASDNEYVNHIAHIPIRPLLR